MILNVIKKIIDMKAEIRFLLQTTNNVHKLTLSCAKRLSFPAVFSMNCTTVTAPLVLVQAMCRASWSFGYNKIVNEW